MKLTTAGFLLRSNDLYLICHITQDSNYIYKESDPFWSIPKGTVEERERPIQAALREVKEETGLDLREYFEVPPSTEPFHVYETKHKIYYIFFINDMTGHLTKMEYKCESIIDNPKYKIRNGLPEHDMFRWVTKEKAKELVFESLKHIFDLHDLG